MYSWLRSGCSFATDNQKLYEVQILIITNHFLSAHNLSAPRCALRGYPFAIVWPLARNFLYLSNTNREQFDISEEIIPFMKLEECPGIIAAEEPERKVLKMR